MKPCQILVVEDESIVAMDIEDRLVAMGYELVGRAASGEQALLLVKERHPDLVLMDIRLQGIMNGIDAAEQIREGFHIPVIFLTAYSEDETLERAKRAQPFGYILKPFDDRELKSTIEIALFKHRAEEEIRRLNRLYDVLSQVNQAIVRVPTRQELLDTICRLVVERGAVDLAWIGWLDQSTSKIIPLACFGDRTEILSRGDFYADDRSGGQGNPGKAVRAGKSFICNECGSAACLYPSVKSPAQFGFHSCASFPIAFQGKVCGALSLCVGRPDFFREHEIELMKEVAMDVSFALDRIESEAQRKQAEMALSASEGRLRLFIEHAPVSLAMFDREMRYLSASRRWLCDYNLGECDLRGLSHYEVFPEIPEYLKEIHRRALSGEVVRADNDRFDRADGSVQWLRWEVRPWSDSKGDVDGIVIFSEDITERKRTEASLQKSEERYRLLIEAANEGIWAMDAEHRTTYVNQAMADMLGYTPFEMMGRRVEEYFFPEDMLPHEERMRKRHAGEDEVYERRFRRRDGFPLWTLVSAKALKNSEGDFAGGVAMFTDITKRKQAEDEREAAVEFLRLMNLCKTKKELIKEAVIFFQQKSGCEAVGIRLREGDDYPYYETRGFPSDFVLLENQLCVRDREGKPILDNAGNPVLECMCGNVICGRCDPSKPFFTPNGSFWSNHTTELLASTTEADRQARTRNRCNGQGYESVALIALRTADEPFGLLQLNDSRRGCFTLEAIAEWERLAAYLAVALSKFKAEEAVEQFKHRNELLLNSTEEGILGLDSEGRHLFANPSALNMLGYDADELIGKTGHGVYHHLKEGGEAYPEEECPIYLAYKTGVSCPLTEEVFFRKNGTSFPVRYSSAPIIENDEILGAVVTFRDITLRRQIEREKDTLQAQLSQAQKMEALGTLAGGIAHDFNNILGIIFGYSEIGQMNADDGNRVRKDIQQVLKAAGRAKDLVQQILAFSRMGEQEKKPIQVGLIVKEAMKMLRASLPSTIEIKTDVTSKAVVYADPTQVHQVLMNLCTNAAHAMRDEGGFLKVSLTDLHLEAESDLLPGPYVRLTVEDTGHGIDPSILDKIFDPFFTTKEKGVGTGLGLSVVHGIVKSHGGAIEVESAINKGTAIQVFLPAMEASEEQGTAGTSSLPHGRERILLVDDEPSLASVTKQMLERLGYEVEYRTNGIEALEAFRHQPKEKPFDLVISDMTMPHLTGLELAKELLRSEPTLPIIICTGFSERITEETLQELGVRGLAMKPLSLRAISELIRGVLDRTAL
jgi:PAS domain S-box-containing protein